MRLASVNKNGLIMGTKIAKEISLSISGLLSAVEKEVPGFGIFSLENKKAVAEAMYKEDCIQKLRLNNGFTQKELADVLGVTQSYMAQLESGKEYPTMALVKKLACALNQPQEKIFNLIP